MTEHERLPEPSSGKRSLIRDVLAIMICGLLGATACGVAGWNGQGWAGEWVGPGLGGLLLGAVIGFAFPVLGLGSLFVVMPWAAHNSTKSRFLVIGLWVVILLPTWWATGWSGILSLILKSIPILAVLGLLTWLGVAATKYNARIEQERTP